MWLSGFFPQLLAGTWVTLLLACSSLVVGLLLGILGAMGEIAPQRWIRYPTGLFINLVRGLPELLIIFFTYFGGSFLLNHFFQQPTAISPFLAGTLALGFIFGAYASQTLRSAFNAIPKQQIEAGIALGMPRYQIGWRIIFPQLWRKALPGLGNLWFVLLKDTALVSLIGLSDLMGKTQIAASSTQQPFTFYLAAACIYLLLTSISMYGLHCLTRKPYV